jgi:hypothetical protein
MGDRKSTPYAPWGEFNICVKSTPGVDLIFLLNPPHGVTGVDLIKILNPPLPSLKSPSPKPKKKTLLKDFHF